MLLLIDNYDSFTYNLFHYLSHLGCKVDVIRNDKIKSENIREQILKNSPNENKDFFVVPKVVE